MKVGEETNFGRLATIFQICSNFWMLTSFLKTYFQPFSGLETLNN